MSLGSPDESNNPDGTQGHETPRRCPKCGEQTKKLPIHMRACDGGSGDDSAAADRTTDDGEVWVATRMGRRDEFVFHDDDDCKWLASSHGEFQRRDRDTLPPRARQCKECAGEVARKDREFEERSCPLCGATVKKLPAHLPCDGGDEA